MSRPEKITKLEAAERQLGLAVRLFFSRADMVGVHTLSAAASQLLRDLASRRGISSPLRENDIIRPEKKVEWIGILNKAQNFFKHADRDPEAILNFFPGATPWMIFEAALMHNAITSAYLPETLLFITWSAVKFPDILKEGALKSVILRHVQSGVDPEDFAFMLEALAILTAEYRKGNWPPKFESVDA